ncbi:MAG: GLPGLI family protein [Bacteroidota bacterium]
MKITNLFSSLLALLFTTSLLAQTTSGMVYYEETIELNIETNEETSQFAHLLPSSQTNHFILRFTPEHAHYTVDEKPAPPPPPQAEGEPAFQIKIMRSSDNSAVYTNLEEKSMVEQRNIFGRPFRIQHELDGGDWRLINEQRTILGYTCMKAVTGPDTLQTVAWFTPQIPAPVGPATYGELPGLILELERDNITLKATEVVAEIEQPELMQAPSKGKKVSEEEFERIQQEKLEEMNIGSGRRIEIRRGR